MTEAKVDDGGNSAILKWLIFFQLSSELSFCGMCGISGELMGPLQLSDHMVQNCLTGEQFTQWHMLNNATKFQFSLFNMSQCVICSPVW